MPSLASAMPAKLPRRALAFLLVVFLLLPPLGSAMDGKGFSSTLCNPEDTSQKNLQRCAWRIAGYVTGLPAPSSSEPPMQADSNNDGYGDSWMSPYVDYASDLADKLQDLENNLQGDGLRNIDEFRWLTVPIGPLGSLFPNAMDYDGDNWLDGVEVAYWNDPSNDPKLDPNGPQLPSGVAVLDPDYAQNFDNDAKTTTHDPDSDGDGLLDGDEFNTYQSYPEFKESDCAVDGELCKSPAQAGTTWSARRDSGGPGRGDNITDPEEIVAWSLIAPGAWGIDFDGDRIASNLLDPDSDADGVLDGDEFDCRTLNATNPNVGACTRADMIDTDRDGLSDGTGEGLARTDPLTPDTDADGLPDGWEHRYHLNPLDAGDAGMDMDNDGLSNLDEYSYRCVTTPCPVSPIYHSELDPTNPDMEQDALLDGEEVAWDADPFNRDSDFDGLRDGEEVHAHATSPTARDSDDDGLTDYQEVVTYRAQRPDPTRANTDDCCNTTENDILTDYQEIIQYRTNVTNWDTDADGEADGRDARPLNYDAKPTRVDLASAPSPIQPRQEAYVIFREEGYVDVMVQDAHGAEGDIEAVEVTVQLSGMVNGASGSVLVRQEAERLDDGALWGARIGVPSRMTQATSESFVLSVVGSSGNVASYTGTASIPMNAVSWQDDSDPVSEWSHLIVHDGPGNTPAGSAGFSADIPRSVDPWNLSVEEIFAQCGTFAVYRLKPFALAEEALALVPDSTAYAKLHTISVSVENASGEDLSDAGWNITLWEDAFEPVNPAEEPGLYASMASGGPSYFRTPKWLRNGMLAAWDMTKTTAGVVSEEAIAQGASFIFGSDDPRAKGRLSGDIVAGILVYGDVRDVVVGTIKEDEIKLALGGIGIGLTFVGPQADGPYGAFKSGIKLIRSVPEVGPRVAMKLVTDLRDEIKLARSAGDTAHAFRFVMNEADIALWATRNTDKLLDFERLTNTFDRGFVNALAPELDNVVALSADAARAFPGDEAAAQALLRRFVETNSRMFPQAGQEAFVQVAEAAKGLRDASPADVPDFIKNVDLLRDVEGAETWWFKAHRGMSNEGDGIQGYAFEASQSAMLLREGKLDRIDGALENVFYKGQPTRVQADAFAKTADGKNILTEFKSKKDPTKAVGSNYDTRTQMERQAAGVAQYANDLNLEKEIHWRFSSRPTEPLRDYAAKLEETYKVRFRFFDAQGIEFIPA